MSASDHLHPQQFGPVHKWLQSKEGENWSREKSVGGVSDWHDRTETRENWHGGGVVAAVPGFFHLREDRPSPGYSTEAGEVSYSTAYRPNKKLPVDESMLRRAHP